MAAVPLSWNTNMAAVTSRESTQGHFRVAVCFGFKLSQEPMTRSLQLPYWAYVVTAFLQTNLFLDYLFRKKQRQFRFGDPMTSA